MQKIFRLSVGLQGKDAQQKCVSIDTTVQEKNITFPTDLKLAVRIIAKCRKMAEKQGIPLRQSYKRTLKQHMLNQRFKDHPKNKKKALDSERSRPLPEGWCANWSVNFRSNQHGGQNWICSAKSRPKPGKARTRFTVCTNLR